MIDRSNETECDVEPAAAQNIARRLVRDWRVLQAWAERHRDAAPQGSHDRRFYDGRALSFATCIEQLCAAFGMEAKMGDGMGHANECVTSTLDDVLSEASKRVAEWPDWKRSDDVKRRQAEFDARMKSMRGGGQGEAKAPEPDPLAEHMNAAIERDEQSAIERAHADGIVEGLRRAEMACELRDADVIRRRISDEIYWASKGTTADRPPHVDRAAPLELATGWESDAKRLSRGGRNTPAGLMNHGEARGLGRAADDLRRLLDAPRGPGGGESEPDTRSEVDRLRDGQSSTESASRAGFIQGLRRATAIVRERCGGSREADLVNAFDRAAAEACGSVEPAMSAAEVEACAAHEQMRGAEVRELRAEVERLRSLVLEFQRATGVLRPEWAKMRIESLEDGDYEDPLRHECRGCGRPISWEGACGKGCGGAAPPYTYGRGGENDPLAQIAIKDGDEESEPKLDRLRAELTATVAALARREEEIVAARAHVGAKDDEALIDAFRRVCRESADYASKRAAQERDAAYRRGQEEMREWASTWCDSEASKMQSRGEHSQASTLWHAYQEIRAIPIANAPTVSSVGTGEADPVERGVETAGAGESVARGSADAAEIARLQSGWRESSSLLGERIEEIRAWRTATACDSPAVAKRRIDQLVADLSLARENRAHFAEVASERRENLRGQPPQRAREPKEGDRVMFGSASGPHVAILLEFIPHAGPEGRGRVRDLETLEVHEAWPGNSLVRGTFKLID